MERELFPPLPLLLQRIAAVAEEERRLNARCTAAGLRPFPPSVIGLCLYTSTAQPFLLSHRYLHLQLGLDVVEPILENPVKVEPQQLPMSESVVPIPPERTCLHLFSDPPPPPVPRSPSAVEKRRTSNRTAARRRRMGVSERVRELAGLMPWDRKVDTSTLLEEARRYVLFLTAQVEALRWMTVVVNDEEDGRRKLMSIVVNSRGLQDWMYRREVCVCCVEQQMTLLMGMAGPSPTPTGFSSPSSSAASSSSLAQLQQP